MRLKSLLQQAMRLKRGVAQAIAAAQVRGMSTPHTHDGHGLACIGYSYIFESFMTRFCHNKVFRLEFWQNWLFFGMLLMALPTVRAITVAKK